MERRIDGERGEAMDPLQELAEANVELGNRPAALPPQPVMRRSMSREEYAAQELERAVASRPMLVVAPPRVQGMPMPMRHFSAGIFGTLGALLVLGIIGVAWHYSRDVTLDKFSRIPIGATVEQANEVMGFTGSLVSSAHASKPINGLNGLRIQVRIDVYTWRNREAGAMSGTFEDGILVSKAQLGLQ